jgi:hypothetical protein
MRIARSGGSSRVDCTSLTPSNRRPSSVNEHEEIVMITTESAMRSQTLDADLVRGLLEETKMSICGVVVTQCRRCIGVAICPALPRYTL